MCPPIGKMEKIKMCNVVKNINIENVRHKIEGLTKEPQKMLQTASSLLQHQILFTRQRFSLEELTLLT